MKILFINTYDIKGGAGIAAFRLGQALEKYYHTENYFLVSKKSSTAKNVIVITQNKFQWFFERLSDQFFNLIGLQYFWFPFSRRNIFKRVKEIKPDVISLHNIHGGYFETSLIPKLEKYAPIVWTLHDMWGFLRNAAHAFHYDSWKQLKPFENEKNFSPRIQFNTSSYLLKRKKKIYDKSSFTVVTPSAWLMNLAKQSPAFSRHYIAHIYNGIDTNFFCPLNKEACRVVLGLPNEQKILMFCAPNMGKDPYKGGDIMIPLLKKLDESTSVRLTILIIGSNTEIENGRYKNLDVHIMGYVTSEYLLRICYSSADLFIYLTKADNLPYVLIEAISCGTPCLTFDVGGCREIVKDEISGKVIEADDITGMIQNILTLLMNNEYMNKLTISGREYAIKAFSDELISKSYYNLFNEVVRGKNNIGVSN